jgi:hypothetical protein
MSKLIKAVREASVSIACLLDEIEVDNVDDMQPITFLSRNLKNMKKDIKHIQTQITTIENFLEPFTVAELEELRNDT